MQAGIMDQFTVPVDVRDMLCAQALAVVAQAVERLRPNVRLEVISNAEDVQQDLIAWASTRGHAVEQRATNILWITPHTLRDGNDVEPNKT